MNDFGKNKEKIRVAHPIIDKTFEDI